MIDQIVYIIKTKILEENNMDNNTKRQFNDFLLKFKIVKIVSLISAYFCLNILSELLYIKCNTFNTWCFESFLYCSFFTLIFFFNQLLMNFLAETYIKQIKNSKFYEILINLNLYLSIIIFFILFLIKLFILYFAYKYGTDNFENIFEMVIAQECLFYTIILFIIFFIFIRNINELVFNM